MDLTTDDPRALRLAARLVVTAAAPECAEWTDPETGTTCRLEADGTYDVLRRVGDRMVPVVAGQVLPVEATSMLQDPDSVRTRRAAAHAIVAVDGARR